MTHKSESPAAFDGFSDDQIDRFLAGKSTPEESKLFLSFLQNAESAESWQDVFQAFEYSFKSDIENGTAETLLKQRLGELPWRLTENSKVASGNNLTAANSSPQSYRRRFFARAHMTQFLIAAVVMVTVALGWQINRSSTPVFNQSTGFSTYTTANGQRSEVILPDGSRVSLNVGSTLQVPVNYSNNNRSLRLEGQALFTVVHGSETPFIVEAGNSTTRVLGTRFTVRSYATDTAISIAVKDGRVSVADRNSLSTPVVVSASQGIEVNERGVTNVKRIGAENFTFAEGVLSLNGVPLKYAIAELGRWFDADVQLADRSLENRRITGTFSAGSITDLVAILSVAFDDIGIIQNGRIVTLHLR